MKWFHWVILACVAVAGLLIYLFMLGKSEDVNEKMQKVREAKALKKIESETEEPKPEEPVSNEPTA